MKGVLETIDENQSLHVEPNDQIIPDSESKQASNKEIQLTLEDVNHMELWNEIRDMKWERDSFEVKEAQ